MESKHSLFKSFGFAFEGLKVALANGRNFRIQLTVGLAAILTGLFLNISAPEIFKKRPVRIAANPTVNWMRKFRPLARATFNPSKAKPKLLKRECFDSIKL